jgi:glyoxylase-like metal-dependent hydrolase (beta-lactamase superfamily II)
MVHELGHNLFAIKIRLVGNPLKDLNTYVFLGKERNLLVDTGFNQKECMEDLSAGIRELNLDMERTDVFVTHLHADHSGLAGQIIRGASRVIMGAVDKAFIEMRWYANDGYAKYVTGRYLREGFPPEEFNRAFMTNPSTSLVAVKPYPITPVNEGDTITVGERNFLCLFTPGHTPGHICLYEPEEKLMVLGDHVLFGITPNITSWPGMPNALKSYLDSLRKIRAYDVAVPLPGHRECHCPMNTRIDELLAHHKFRLEETVKILTEDPGVNAYTVASRLTWSIRAKSWQDFPLAQKWFAFGEALAHLDYLAEAGVISRGMDDGITSYRVGTR